MRKIMASAGFIVLWSWCIPAAHSDQISAYVRQSLSGIKAEKVFIDGGVLYGTHVFQEVHLCPSGRYIFYEQRRKQTVLGNEQVSNSEDAGRWDVAPAGGQTGIYYRSDYGNGGGFIPIRVLPNGRVQLPDGFSRTGRAQCR